MEVINGVTTVLMLILAAIIMTTLIIIIKRVTHSNVIMSNSAHLIQSGLERSYPIKVGQQTKHAAHTAAAGEPT